MIFKIRYRVGNGKSKIKKIEGENFIVAVVEFLKNKVNEKITEFELIE